MLRLRCQGFVLLSGLGLDSCCFGLRQKDKVNLFTLLGLIYCRYVHTEVRPFMSQVAHPLGIGIVGIAICGFITLLFNQFYGRGFRSNIYVISQACFYISRLIQFNLYVTLA